jgi:4-hydroxy-3-methylbut-2-enyl diphosphate reductase
MKTAEQTRTIILASPHGFCAGVERAVAMAEALLVKYPKPVYCLRQIVHNRQVIDALTAKGMVFVQDISEIPHGGTVLFSAHGLSPGTRDAARQRGLHAIDATCPFVTKVHHEVRRYGSQGFSVLLVGDRHHDEIVGVASESPEHVTIIETEAEAETVTVPDPDEVAVMTQTTLSLDELAHILTILRRRFPALKTPSEMDICYATRNRQQAVKQLAGNVEAFIILGSESSSNSNRLAKVAQSEGCPGHLVSSLERLATVPLDEVTRLGLTAGASTPEHFVKAAIVQLQTRGFDRVEEFTAVKEDTHFTLP